MRDDPSFASGKNQLPAMGLAYALGTFNDNFFKQAILLLAVVGERHTLQGTAALLFALPFVLFSAWAGWLADRLPKNSIILASKAMELAAMLLGVLTLYSLHWFGMVAVVFLMGLQSTLFSPALNGSIPENFPASAVPQVNALFKLATTSTILLGIVLGGVFLDLPGPVSSLIPEGPYGFGRLAVGCGAVLISLTGLIAAAFIRSTPPASPSSQAPFPFFGPADSFRHARHCYVNDEPLFLVLAGEAFFYCISSFTVLCINNLGISQIGLSLTCTSLLSVALMAGICLGALRAGKREAETWRRIMPPAGKGMALGLLLASLAPILPGQRLPFIFLLLVFLLTGFCGGLYLIPLTSFIQIRPSPAEKGKILGISNFASFSGVILSGLIFNLGKNFTPALLLTGGGLITLLFLNRVSRRIRSLPDSSLADKATNPLSFALRAILSLRYRIRAVGLERIPSGGSLLFLPNHPALIDPIVLYALLAGAAPRPLADSRQMAGLLGRLAAKITRAVLIPDPSKDKAGARQGVEAGLRAMADALRGGSNALLYPSGRIYRSAQETLGGNSGAATLLASCPETRTILVRCTGLWGSSFSYAGAGKPPDFLKALLRGLLTLMLNLWIFTPRREVLVEFTECSGLPRNGDKKTLNRRLEEFYKAAEKPALAVPRFFWQGNRPIPLPDYDQAAEHRRLSEKIPASTRTSVYAVIRRAAGLAPEHPLTDQTALGADLGLDSLARVTLALALETEHGQSIPRLEDLVTVGDCLAAVTENAAEGEAAPVPPVWFKAAAAQIPALSPQAVTLPDAFWERVRQAPGSPLLADRQNLRNRREALIGALVLAGRFALLPEKRLGIMLPSVPAVTVVWLAALLAGKEAVFFNWTVGEANLRHCLKNSGVTRIITSAALLERLERGGIPLSLLPVSWLRLEELAPSISLREKIFGALRAHLPGRLAFPRRCSATDTAAVLFTSGSEALPKAVPLTHANLLTNAKDIITALRIGSGDTILAMLPPFHSFGLMVGLVLPLAMGLRAAFHPNPTETGPLLALLRDYKLTLLAAPPTFLEAMLDRAQGGTHLESLRFAFVGAEKCPDHVYRAFARCCPGAALCEGYGITECSPVISVNRPESIVPGSIGHPMPSLEIALVREVEGLIADRVKTGDTGMLLVRGPSIFPGYLGAGPDPFVLFENKRWYRTGDLVSQDEDGRLTFRGRLKRFVKIGGEMISLPQLENALLEAFSSRAAPDAEGPVLAVEASAEEKGRPEITIFTTLDLPLEEANAALRAAGLSALHSAKRLIRLKALPLLGSGKTDYLSLKELLK